MKTRFANLPCSNIGIGRRASSDLTNYDMNTARTRPLLLKSANNLFSAAWIRVLLLGTLTLTLAPIAPSLRKLLQVPFNSSEVKLVSIIILGLLLIIFVQRLRRHTFTSALIFGFSIAGSLLAVIGTVQTPIEYTHLPTYGLFAITCFLALKTKSSSGRIILALMLSALLSILDEAFQHFLPMRVGDPQDLLLNLLCAFHGLALWCFFSFSIEKSST